MPKTFAAEGLRKPGAATTPLVHLQVPPGMDAALRGLTREVLRRQPSDLYLFAHRYFESLLADRVAQEEEDVTDAESLFSKKRAMRDLFREDESRRSREIVHRIHLEDDASPDKNVVHNINIEVEGEDASIEETTVKVEITGDEGKKKRRENIDKTSFEEEITTTRTEHMTVCKSWKVETRVETSESGEIRVESFTNAGKTKQSSKPRKFASEEDKKSQSLTEEKRAAKAQREKTKRESSKSKSFENVDKSTNRELIMLERQADADKVKTDEGKKYKSFVQLDDDSVADESERLIAIEREEALTRSRRDVGDLTREVSPDGSILTQSPQIALQKMEESLIQLREIEAKADCLKKEEDLVQVFSEGSEEKQHSLTSPEDALIQMEKSLIELKGTSLASAAETRKDEVPTDLEKGSLEEKPSVSIKSEGKSKSSDISEEKHKIIESVKEVVHEIEGKASTVSSHIHGSQITEEKQSIEECKSLEEKHKLRENVKDVVHKIEEKASTALSLIHGSQSSEEKQSLKSEDESISEKRYKIIEDVKEVVHDIEKKTSGVLTHFPEKMKTSIPKADVNLKLEDKESIVVEAQIETEAEKNSGMEKKEISIGKTDVDLNPDYKKSIVGEAQIEAEAEKRSESEKAEPSSEKTEVQDRNTEDKGSGAVDVHTEGKGPEPPRKEDEKTEVLDSSGDDKESSEVKVQKGIEKDRDRVEHLELDLGSTVVEAEAIKQSPEPDKTESSVVEAETSDLKGENSIVVEACMLAEDAVESTEEKLETLESSAEQTENLYLKGKKRNEEKAHMREDDVESSAKKTEALDATGTDNIAEKATIKAEDREDTKEKQTKSSAGETEALNAQDSKDIVEEASVKAEDAQDSEEKLKTKEDSVGKTEAVDLKSKETTVEQACLKPQDSKEEKPVKMKCDEKTEDLDLGANDSISLETRTEEHEVEDVEKGSLGERLKSVEEAGGKKEQKGEVESKGRQTREVEAANVDQKAGDDAASYKKPDLHNRESKEESSEEGLARQSSKEEKWMSSRTSKEVEGKKTDVREQFTVDGHKKEKETEKRSAESTKNEEHEDKSDDTVPKKKDKESPEDDTQKKIAAESLEEKGGQNESKKEPILLPTESEHKEAVKVTERKLVEDPDGSTVKDTEPYHEKETQEDLASKGEVLGIESGQLQANVERNIIESKSSIDTEKLEEAAAESTAVKDAAAESTLVKDTAVETTEVKAAAAESAVIKDTANESTVITDAADESTLVRGATMDGSASQVSTEKEETAPESESKEMRIKTEEPQEKTAAVEEEEVKTKTEPVELGKETSQVVRVRRSTEETFTNTEEVSESTSTSIMTQTILLGGPGNEVKSMQTEVKEHQEEKMQMKTHVIKKEVVDVDDVFGRKMYPIGEVNTFVETTNVQDDQGDGGVEEEAQVEGSAEKTSEPVAKSFSEVKAQYSVESSDGVEDRAEKSKEGEESTTGESSEEKPRQRKLASLDEESSSVSEGTGDGFLPPTVVISRVADVVELTDGEAKIVSQMEKEGLTTDYDESIKMKTGYWSAEDAQKFIIGESQHTYHTLRKPELVYSDLHESRPPEKSLLEETENATSDEPEKSKEVEPPAVECLVDEQDESSPDKTDSLGRYSDSKEGPVEFSLVEVDNDGKEIKEDKPWLARAHTVEEFFEKETVGEVTPIAPTPSHQKSAPGQVNVMMEMSKATSRIGQSIMVLSRGEKRPVQRSDSDEYCISADAIYIPLRPPGAEPDVVEESDEEPFRIDQPPPTFTYDTDEGEWGAALDEHVEKYPSLTSVIIERKADDPSALGRVTITEITDEEDKAMSTEHAKESKATTMEEQPKPVFEIGSPVSDRNTDLNELRTDAKHRPSLADISEENLESADDNDGSMNVELHISLSDGDNLSQRSYGTDSERKWTDDLTNVATKAKDAATGMIKNLFGSSPRKDRHSPVKSESSLVSEASMDNGKRTRKRSESQEEYGTQQEVVAYETKEDRIEAKSVKSTDKHDSGESSKKQVSTKSTRESKTTGKDFPGQVIVEVKDKVTPRSLQESSQTSLSLTSVSLPLPDASYNLPNVSTSTSTDGSPADSKDVFEDGVPSDPSKPQADGSHQLEEYQRLKRSVEQEVITIHQSDEQKETDGFGSAAGTAVQKEAEPVQDEHEKTDTRVSPKDQKETGLASQEAASEPKDSMTSVISETLDSVESLPSEVSKNLWSIEDVPLSENLIESGVQEDENQGSENSSNVKIIAVDEVLETLERRVETVEDKVDGLKDKGKEEVKRGEEKVKEVAREVKEDVRHKLSRAAEAMEDSLEDVGNEGKRIESQVEQGLKDKAKAIQGTVTTAEDDIKDVRKDVEDVKEHVEETGEDIKEKMDEGEAEVVATLEKGRSVVGGMLDSVGDAISDAKEKVASVLQEEERRVEELEERDSEKVDEVNANISENLTQDIVEEKVEKGKSAFGKFIGGVADALGDVKEKISDIVTHAKEDVKSIVSKKEKLVEKEVSDIEDTVEEESKKVESGIEEKMKEAGKFKSEVVEEVECRVLTGKDKVKEIAEIAGEEVKEVKVKIGKEVEKTKGEIEGALHEVADKVKQSAKIVGGDAETVTDDCSKIAGSIIQEELDEVEKRLEDSIEREDEDIDTVDGAKGTGISQQPKVKGVGESAAEATSSTRMVLDKRKGDGNSEDVEASKVLARSIESPGIAASADEANTDSSGKEDSSETRRLKLRMLKRGVTLGDLPRSTDTFPSESVDETSFERADTVVHMTPDEPRQEEEEVIYLHVEDQEASPVPPGKDTKSTETDLLEKETVSRGTEPEETSEQIAEALRSEVKDLEERLSRLRESTWSLSHSGPDPRKEGRVHTSKGQVDGDDLTERTVHVKKSISSAESTSFASRVLSTPLGSLREEFSEMKKSMAETTLETVLTVEKGVQSEGSEVGGGGRGSTGPKTTATTATQVSVPSNDTSDDESRKVTFQRAKSMDAKTEARAITNFSKRNSRKTVETKKTDPSKTQQKESGHATECQWTGS